MTTTRKPRRLAYGLTTGEAPPAGLVRLVACQLAAREAADVAGVYDRECRRLCRLNRFDRSDTAHGIAETFRRLADRAGRLADRVAAAYDLTPAVVAYAGDLDTPAVRQLLAELRQAAGLPA